MTAKKRTSPTKFLKCRDCGSSTFFRYTEVCDKIKMCTQPGPKTKRKVDKVSLLRVRVIERECGVEEKDINCTECGEEY